MVKEVWVRHQLYCLRDHNISNNQQIRLQNKKPKWDCEEASRRHLDMSYLSLMPFIPRMDLYEIAKSGFWVQLELKSGDKNQSLSRKIYGDK